MSGVHRIDGQVEGTHDEKPDASPANAGILYIETDTGFEFYSNGQTWIQTSDGSGGGGGAPSGSAGGDLGSTYPNPTVLHLAHVTDASLPSAGIAALDAAKLTGTVALARIAGLTTTQLAAAAGILGSQIDAAAGIASGQIASLDGSKIAGSHTIPDAALSANVPLLDEANSFSAQQTVASLDVLAGLSQGDGTATATHGIKMGDGQTALPFSITDHADAPKASIAADGEIVTVDDVLAPFGTVKGAVLAFAPTVGTGAPSIGAHNAGEMVMDSTGAVFVCTATGSPGTWKQATLT